MTRPNPDIVAPAKMTIPDRLGKYTVSEVLGRGAMGVVYKGFDPHIRRAVAIKTIRRDLIDEEQVAALLARFRNEAQAAGQLSHPGVVSVYEWGEAGDIVFLAMEYVAGNSLREYFNRGTRFENHDAVSIMAQLLDALNHAHEQGVWHRDIKPSNIIIMGNGRLKVADFGIARIETSTLTQTGAIMGTPGYMAPEQYCELPVDWRADIFAAGVVMYQLLTGARPFSGTAESVAYSICHVDPLPPSQADPARCSAQFDAVAMKALAKNPAERYETAAAFRDALLAAYAAPVSAAVSEDTVITELIRPGRRNGASPSTVPSGGSLASQPPGPATAPQPAGTTIPPPGWQAEVLKQIEQQLSRIVGPVARILVKRGAAVTTDVDRLYRSLAENLPDPRDRVAFLAGRKELKGVTWSEPGTNAAQRGDASESAPTVQLTGDAIEQATRRLAADLGPLARAVAKRAATQATSRRHFHQLLAEKLTDPAERTRFLRDLGSE